jgi:hypothetical protein
MRHVELGQVCVQRMQEQAQRRKGDLRLVLESGSGQYLTAPRREDAGRHVQQRTLADSRISEDHQRGALLGRLGGEVRDPLQLAGAAHQ